MARKKKRIPMRKDGENAYVSTLFITVIDRHKQDIESEFNKKMKDKQVSRAVVSEIFGEILRREGESLLKKHKDILRKYKHRI